MKRSSILFAFFLVLFIIPFSASANEELKECKIECRESQQSCMENADSVSSQAECSNAVYACFSECREQYSSSSTSIVDEFIASL